MNFDPESIVFALRNRDAITIDELVQFTGELPSDYYKYLYDEKYIVPCSPPTDFDIEIFLKFCSNPALEERLFKSGVFFDINAKVKILEAFHSMSLSSATTWPVKEADLQTLIWGSRNPSDGVTSYFDMYIGKDKLLEKVSSLIADYLNMEESSGAVSVANYLYQELNAGLEWAHIRRHFISILFERAVQMGYIEHSTEAQVSISDFPPAVVAALGVLELDATILPKPETLKSAYRALLLKYHPDIKADGAEHTVAINEAYAVLLPLV